MILAREQRAFFDWLDDQPQTPRGVFTTTATGETRIMPPLEAFAIEIRSARQRRARTRHGRASCGVRGRLAEMAAELEREENEQ